MNHRYTFSIHGSPAIAPGIFVAVLMVLGSIIVGLADAEMRSKTHKWTEVTARRLDVNSNGFISLSDLTSDQNRRSQKKVDRNDDIQTEKTKFDASLLAMLKRLDGNSDNPLDDDEISKLENYRHGFGLREKAF